MSRFIRVAACAALAGVEVRAACFLPDSVVGQDQFQAVNMAYIECKRMSGIDQQALCTCSTNQMIQVEGCAYSWINPWISTVMRDKGKFCGAASSGSFASSLSGSDGSSPSIGTSSQSGSSNQHLTTPQKLFFLALALCCCLCVCGGVGGLYAMKTGAFKGKKTKPKQYDYEEEDQQDYEAQQYDQQFGDQGAADYQGQEMAGAPQDGGERWDMVQSPVEPGMYPGEVAGQPLMQPGQF